MKTPLLIACFCVESLPAFCQETKLVKYRRPEEGYYLYEVPSAINGSNIDPSPYSNLTANTGDASVSFKYGSLADASLNTETAKAPTITSVPKLPKGIQYYFVQLDIKATNGVSSIFSKGNPLPDIGLSTGFTPYFSSTYWTYTKANDSTRVGTISTRWSQWMNVRASTNVATLNVFNDVDTPAMTKEKITNYPYSIFLSYNSFYSSDFNSWNKFKSSIFSFGAGFAKTNNYASLKKRTFEEGTIYQTPNSATYKAITDETAGGIGPFKQYQGLAVYAELYKPLTKLYHDGSQKYNFYIGGRATYYGLLCDSHTINSNGGLFLNIKKGDVNVHKRREDALNLALTANFQDLEKVGEKHYWADKFGVSVSASVPLKLN